MEYYCQLVLTALATVLVVVLPVRAVAVAAVKDVRTVAVNWMSEAVSCVFCDVRFEVCSATMTTDCVLLTSRGA